MAAELDKYVAFIPVRGGSKSIPLKNIKEIGGKPLMHWVLEAATQCALVDRVVVSTDDSRIAAAVEKLSNSKVTVFWRSPETATDTASTESAMLEFAKKQDFKNIILLQATSPLTTSNDLTEAIRLYDDSQADGLLSVVRQKRFIWKEGDDGKSYPYLLPQNYNPNARPRRQEFDGFLVENGAIYITSREALLRTKTRISGNIVGYEMKEETYFELDEPSDWNIIDGLLSQRQQERKASPEKDIRLFIMDCDGVLTDGGMYYTHEGHELKKFNTRDGMGIRLLREKGIKTAIITGEHTPIVTHRANKLKLDDVYLGIEDKLAVFQELLKKYNLTPSNVAYIGDDINDLPVLKIAGLSFTVSDASLRIKNSVHHVTKAKGGAGAVREACEFIIENYLD